MSEISNDAVKGLAEEIFHNVLKVRDADHYARRILEAEDERDDVYMRGIRSMLMIRCMKHFRVPQYNRQDDGSECAACEAEALRETGAELERNYLERIAHLEAERSAGIVALCVCSNAATPVPGCACVTCTVKRAEARESELRDRFKQAVEAMKVYQDSMEGLAEAVRQVTEMSYPWPAQDFALPLLKAAIAAAESALASSPRP